MFALLLLLESRAPRSSLRSSSNKLIQTRVKYISSPFEDNLCSAPPRGRLSTGRPRPSVRLSFLEVAGSKAAAPTADHCNNNTQRSTPLEVCQ